jgi:hypothetical protein
MAELHAVGGSYNASTGEVAFSDEFQCSTDSEACNDNNVEVKYSDSITNKNTSIDESSLLNSSLESLSEDITSSPVLKVENNSNTTTSKRKYEDVNANELAI